MKQKRQGIHPTKPNCGNHAVLAPLTNPNADESIPKVASKEFHTHLANISKIYNYDMVPLAIHSRSENQYIMLAYHCNSNSIHIKYFQSKSERHRIATYNMIIYYLNQCGHW